MVEALTVVETEQELEFKDTKIPYLKLATGGKGPPIDPEDPVWLKRYEEGTQFVVRKKGVNDFVLGRFYILGKGEKLITLFGKGIGEIDVDPARFCSVYELYEIAQTAEEFRLLHQQQLEEPLSVDGSLEAIPPQE